MNSNYFHDLNYLHKISNNLERFHQSQKGVFGCRCVVCGDSKKDSRKTRLFFYTRKHQLNVFCHNCNYSSTFRNFLKLYFPIEFNEYKKELLFSSLKTPKVIDDIYNINYKQKNEKGNNITKKFLESCQPLSELDEMHIAIKYVRSRKLGDEELLKLFYSDDFKKTSEIVSQKPLSDKFPNESRLIIPFFSSSGEIEMIQGRSIGNSSLRYITIKSSDDVDKVFGKYNIDRSKTVYCCEGPIDSLFVDNCLATCDSSLLRANADVYIYDNEPRNKEIVNLIEKTINLGKDVVIWPVSPDKKIDINDMIIGGLSKREVNEIIKNNTFGGIAAKLKLSNWRKV